ncbi:chromate efflux transporter [Pseudoduganella buxea]|uniref:Chromate efflux transporter n=1 Tax=Pseudoduganella buxea TaxID=1949069 RepID=A0A6I3SSL3_9BURK|nr:chromate efflux transporter [Pseudoduganella buxea]MTV52123.1 chromate efflux transporter [Pseudoduganella buxea]GGB91819.1 chromate transporter [Pseudoduganella buxea]
MSPAPSIPLATALRYWLKLGFISFGGPAGQIAMMHAELVERRRWISERRFLHALNYCMLLPGPEATQLAIYIGWLLHRTWGGIVAGLLFLLPSLLLLTGLGWVYMAYGHLPVIAALLYGLKPAVVAIVLAAAWRIGRRTLRNGLLAGIAAAGFAAILLGLPFPLLVLGAGLIGWLGGRFTPHQFTVKAPPATAQHHGPALIDDDTPTPGHARFSRRRLLAGAAVGVLAVAASWALLAAATGTDGPLASMGWFFTKMALLTFGGAYAVLPYVVDGAVHQFGWLTPAQMIDGLALGETTPGPLIMIVAFIGFVGGWAQQMAGSALLSGIAGACVAAWFTFLPSFVFILAGGPLVEATRGNIRLTAPLTAISAAVVGVIASLAVFLASHVLFAAGSVQWPAVAIAVAAAVALLRYEVGTVKLLLGCAIAGLVLSYPGGTTQILQQAS